MKRVLFISYYFPPSGGPGVQRTLKFVKYLPEFGWQPTVLTVDPEFAAYPSLDPSLAAEVPAGIEVVRTRSWDPYGGYARMLGKRKEEAVGVSFGGESKPGRLEKFGRWIRANVFLPDARVGWVPFALRKARALLRRQSFDAILTSGPPHSTHLLGLRLSRGNDPCPPWLADFRDPWTKIDYHQELPTTRVALAADLKLERRVLTRADRVTTVTGTILASFREDVDRHYDLVMNGFDPADFIADPVPPLAGFHVRHIGNMPAARNPESLWKALSLLDATDRDGLSVECVGSVDPAVQESAGRYGVDAHLHVDGYVPHDEAIRRMRESDLLLLVINKVRGAEGIMTGKLFEYIASGRPILGIGPTGGDAAAAIREVGAGEMLDYDDAEGVKRLLKMHLDAKNQSHRVEGASWDDAQAFSRINQTKQLAGILDDMVEPVAIPRPESTGV